MIKSAHEVGYSFSILSSVETVNERQKLRLVEKMRDHFGTLMGKTIALWGLAFKPRTDDMREAPSLVIAHSILADGGSVKAYDPECEKSARAIFGTKVGFVRQSYEALIGADALAIVTEWNEFREPDFARMRSLMRSPVIFDGRNLFTTEQMQAEGFTYYSVGR